MLNYRKILRAPLLWGVFSFLAIFVVSSLISNKRWSDERRRGLGVLIEGEVNEALGALDHGSLVLGAPWRNPRASPSGMILRLVLRGESFGEIRRQLEVFIASRPLALSEDRDEWTSMGRALTELRLEPPGACFPACEALLRRSRWHVSRGQGWFQAGNPERGLIHVLGALVLARAALRSEADEAKRVEAAFVVGQALFLLFGRARVLQEIAELSSSSIWSVRAYSVLTKEFPL